MVVQAAHLHSALAVLMAFDFVHRIQKQLILVTCFDKKSKLVRRFEFRHDLVPPLSVKANVKSRSVALRDTVPPRLCLVAEQDLTSTVWSRSILAHQLWGLQWLSTHSLPQ